MLRVSEKRFPTDPQHYKLYEEIGEGISATVYRALCVPFNEIVAIKIIELEKSGNDIDGIRNEVQTMRLTRHPNLLHAYCSFTSNTTLWVVMPFLSGGSCLHIMKFAYPSGFEESVIAILLREVLKALVYLHSQGYIHRDVKAGNILVGGNGVVQLADFGVSACMFDSGTRQRTRKSFVGTPCWMAPEVMEKTHGYDFKADIWSFGITALELAHGHAPLSKHPPMKVVLLTMQNAPPGLDYDRDKRFSKYFKEMITTCLVKDPKKRPSAEKLLKHRFFKNASSADHLIRTILGGLSPLGKRFKEMKAKEAELLLQDHAADKDKHMWDGYIQGLSGWNFDLDELRAQAAVDENSDATSISKDPTKQREDAKTAEPNISQSGDIKRRELSELRNESPQRKQDMEDSLALPFPALPLRALKECFDVCKEEITPSTSEAVTPERSYVSQSMNLRSEMHDSKNPEARSSVLSSIILSDIPKDLQPSGLPAQSIVVDVPRMDQEVVPTGTNSNLSITSHQNRNTRTQIVTSDENLGKGLVQQRGRFRITPADGLPKDELLTKVGDTVPGVFTTRSVFAGFVISTLRHMLQQTSMQKEQLMKLINHIEKSPGKEVKLGEASKKEMTKGPLSQMQEAIYQSYVTHLQQCNANLIDELQKTKSRISLLERDLGAYLSQKIGLKC